MLSAALRAGPPRPGRVRQERPLYPGRAGRAPAPTFPSARVVVLDHSEHWPFVDDLEGVAGPVLKFLREMTEAPARHGG